MKKGAMFGLDARIALAIFGALSVISGAALYSAISQAKVVAFVTEMNEFAKAREQYLLDVGQELTLLGDRNLKTQELNASILSGWNGPYISWTPSVSYLNHPTYSQAMFVLAPKSPVWNIPTDPTHKCADHTSETCYVWVHITGLTEDFNKQIDEYIDGTVDAQDGNYRWRTDATYYNVGLAFK